MIPAVPNTPTGPTTQGTLDALTGLDIISSRVDFGWVSLTDADKVEIAARQGAAPRDLALMRARLAGLTEEEIALLASP